jgi:hypothetical protein
MAPGALADEYRLRVEKRCSRVLTASLPFGIHDRLHTHSDAMEPHQRAQPDEAMQTDLKQVGLDLCAAGTLWLPATAQNTGAIGKSMRVGLTRNVDRQWRFYERGNPYVSGPKRLRE